MTEPQPPRRNAAVVVAIGILASRLIGLLRARALAHFFGVGAHADVLQAAFRGPNLLQNLLGEGTISASFIPIYSRMLEEGRPEEAGRFAGALFGLLTAVAATLVLVGVWLAEPIVTLLTPGFVGDAARVAAGTLPVNRFDLSVQAVRIIFPMTGMLVLSAWALGVLNSHRRFLIPYLAPVVWNVAIIVALFIGAQTFTEAPPDDPARLNRLLFAACLGALAGGLLQFLVQLPSVVRVIRGFRPSLSLRVPGVRSALASFGPVVAGRGVYQISAYLDLFLASYLAAGALGALQYGQLLYMLPVSLFGLSVAAAELPELSRIRSDDLRPFLVRLEASLRQMMFLTLPTFVGYLGLGYLLVGALFQTGSFGERDNWLIYLVLCGYTLGLQATTASRLLQNACYALRDTRTPARIAVLRVVVSTAVAVPLMFLLDRYSVADVVGGAGGDRIFLGAVGLSAGSAVGAWVEFLRLRSYLAHRVEQFHFPWGPLGRMTALAAAALLPALGVWYLLPSWHIIVQALLVLAVFGGLYVAGAAALRLPELDIWAGQFLRRFRSPAAPDAA